MFQIIKQACDAETNNGTTRIQQPQIVWRSVLLTLNRLRFRATFTNFRSVFSVFIFISAFLLLCFPRSWQWCVVVSLELINEEEQKILTELSRINRTDRIDSEKFRGKNLDTLNEDAKGDRQTAHQEVYPNVFYVPLIWAVNLVNVAKTEKRITEPASYAKLIDVRVDSLGCCWRTWITTARTLVTHNISGPDLAVGSVCVCLCVWTITCKFWSHMSSLFGDVLFHLDNVKVEFKGHGRRNKVHAIALTVTVIWGKWFFGGLWPWPWPMTLSMPEELRS